MTSNPNPQEQATSTDTPEDLSGPPCVMTFNVNDPSGAGGLGGDVATLAAMGAHALPVVTGVLLRDTAEVFDHHPMDDEVIVEQARGILEDAAISAWKVGFLGSAEGVSAVAEVLSDYPDVPLVAHLPNLSWMEEASHEAYHEAFRELVLPQAEVLVGNHKTLTDFLLPDWEADRPASPRELAAAAAEHGTRFVLVTGVQLPDHYVDNVLASAEGAITGEKFERFDTTFVGAGDTLSAALAAMIANGAELHLAVSEALTFLDQSLDAGFRPGMGSVVPDRFFWAQPPAEEGAAEGEGDDLDTPQDPRHVH
ncbi:MAG TPA: bifunctional hydroxymethylpyrimidine kinase/phosphomethylpyrimidine kinase [Burkholderiaceae bacterium]|nr:bifunctional hydroxymethylpyrimidine kinase/phosphomethylpyrimidine kinase [Burkholderiaceae bacterium]